MSNFREEEEFHDYGDEKKGPGVENIPVWDGPTHEFDELAELR